MIIESGGSELTPKEALELLASCNDWLIERIEHDDSCACNHCYLCAYRKLEKVVGTKSRLDGKLEPGDPCDECGSTIGKDGYCRDCGYGIVDLP